MTAPEIIQKIIYMTLATANAEGQPWNTPVFCAYDQDFNFYWGSSKTSRHSKNISANPRVFISIYDSTVPAGEGEGVYIKAKAQELSSPADRRFAHNLLQARRIIPFWKEEYFSDESPIALYKAVPEKVWVNDGQKINGVYEDIRKEVRLP
ncbi:MAG TPA: pyridoxamine 5'-phosphate oxidase family protein [Candidatus Saccharimonadales bacterium]|nr:pyridoxamine 5'-phosphate oxidase family protein [Candidatus Saccharimonadales bacterium]